MVHWQAFSDVIELQPHMYSIQRSRRNATRYMLQMVMLPSPKRAYDMAIKLYSAAIDLDPAIDSIFAHRCRAKLGKMLWEEALGDGEKVHIIYWFVIQADQGYNRSAQRLDSVSPPALESRL